jgi:hypothetical protein
LLGVWFAEGFRFPGAWRGFAALRNLGGRSLSQINHHQVRCAHHRFKIREAGGDYGKPDRAMAAAHADFHASEMEKNIRDCFS